MTITYYIHKQSGTIQMAEPLDIKFRKIHLQDAVNVEQGSFEGKRAVDVLTRLHRANVTTLRASPNTPRTAPDKSLQILEDEHAGLLYYCPFRNLFSCYEKMDVSVGYYENNHGDGNRGYVQNTKKNLHAKLHTETPKPRNNLWEKFSLAPIQKPDLPVETPQTHTENKIPDEDDYFLSLEQILRETITQQATEFVGFAADAAVERVSGSPVRKYDQQTGLDCIHFMPVLLGKCDLSISFN